MKKGFLPIIGFFILFFNVSSVVAQGVSTDSLDKLYDISEEALFKYNYKKSIEVAMELAREASKANDPYFEYNAYNLLGMSYEDLKDTIRAKQYYERALKHARQTNNDTVVWWAYNNLGNIYSQDKRQYKKGIKYYNKAIEIIQQLGTEEGMLTPVLNIGWTYLDNQEYDKAYPYLVQSERLLDNEPESLTQLFTLWGMYYGGKNKPEKATSYFERSIEIAVEDSLFMEASTAYKEYARFLANKTEHEKAYEALEKHLEFQEKLVETERIKQVEAAQARFELDEYRRDLELARKEQIYKDRVIRTSRQGVIILIISAAILLIILLVLFKTNRSKKALIEQLQVKNEQLYKAKEEAVKLSNLKAQFFSTVSHELRTPLYGVVGLTSLLLEDKDIQEKHEDDLKSLKFSADYLLALINDVLQMNKMESNLVKLEKVNFNLYDLMSGIVKSFEFTRLQNKNSIHLEIDKNIPKNLIGDSIRLSQILMNLTGNAMKFTEQGNIWLIARLVEQEKGRSRVYFEVRDNGLGIPQDKQQVIFEEFSQLRNANYNYQGTGLGLPIVKRLLDLFDSEITLTSEEGKGSSFRFEIDFENGTEEDTPQEKRERLNKANLAGKNILVVDDNRINRAVTKRILEKQSVVVDVAVNGEEAIEKVRKGAYDLVLMDVNMPKLNGLEATKQIREFNKEIPIIALTAVEIGEMRGQITTAGMNDIIVKPYDIPQFFQTIMRNIYQSK